MENEIIKISPEQIMTNPHRILDWVRPEINSSYLNEAFDVLKIGRTRPAIGSVWNCVVDDLRNKVLLVGPEIFSRELGLIPPIKVYEDFQDRVLDSGLIEGCYKLGILDHEGYEMMRQALKQRHIFDGHPKSSQPDPIKTLSFINDCIKYVLAVPVPLPAINVDDYMETLRGGNYNRDKDAAQQAFDSMSITYQNQLLNMMFDEYINLDADINIQGNVEFAAPILWSISDISAKSIIAQRTERIYVEGNTKKTSRAYNFVRICNGFSFLSVRLRSIIYSRMLENLEIAFGNYLQEGRAWKNLESLGMSIPNEVIPRYCKDIVISMIGNRYGYSWDAEAVIRRISEKFNIQIKETLFKTLVEKENAYLVSRALEERILEILKIIDGPGLPIDIKNSVDELKNVKYMGRVKNMILSGKF